jgi:hypothetical protein
VPFPAPDIQLLITPPGGSETDYTAYLTYEGANQEMTITQNFGRQGDTAVLPLVVEHSGVLPWFIPPLSQVRLHDSIAGQTLFGGVVANPQFATLGPNLGEYDLQCVDYTFYANGATVRFPPSSIQAPDQIIVALTNGANCGISAATIADGGYVAPGPALPDWTKGRGHLEPGDAELAITESQCRWDLVPGTRWMTFYVLDPFMVVYGDAPPPYATHELATSMCGMQIAAIGAHCALCEAVALPEEPVAADGATTIVSRKIPHAPECLFSAETIARLDAECRPAGYQVPPVTEEEIDLLAEALGNVHKFHGLMTEE